MSDVVLAETNRRSLHARALDQYGYITPSDAEELGIPAIELRKISQRGGVAHVGYGLYRFNEIPPTDTDQYMEAVLRSGPDAHLTHDAVLALHDLAVINPRRIRVGTPHRVRRTLPTSIELIRQRIEPEDLTTYEGVPSTTVRRAILDCRGTVMQDRLLRATTDAGRRGLVPRHQLDKLLSDVNSDHP